MPPMLPSRNARPRRDQRRARQVADTVGAAAIVSYTDLGRDRAPRRARAADVPVIGLTAKIETARRLALVWGVHCVHTSDVTSFTDMVQKAADRPARRLRREGRAPRHHRGLPFGTPGATNVLRIAWIQD